MKEKIKSYDFWMAVASAIFVVLQAVGFTTQIPYLQEITTAFLGFLAVSGFIVKPPKQQTEENAVEDSTASDACESDQNASITEIIEEIIDNTKK